jgi:hypothetical protein
MRSLDVYNDSVTHDVYNHRGAFDADLWLVHIDNKHGTIAILDGRIDCYYGHDHIHCVVYRAVWKLGTDLGVVNVIWRYTID